MLSRETELKAMSCLSSLSRERRIQGSRSQRRLVLEEARLDRVVIEPLRIKVKELETKILRDAFESWRKMVGRVVEDENAPRLQILVAPHHRPDRFFDVVRKRFAVDRPLRRVRIILPHPHVANPAHLRNKTININGTVPGETAACVGQVLQQFRCPLSPHEPAKLPLLLRRRLVSFVYVDDFA